MKTMHPGEDTHVQHEPTTTLEEETRSIDHDYTESLPPCPGQTGGGHVAPQSIDRAQQERKRRHVGDAGNTTNDDPNFDSKASYLKGDDEASTT
jgi:hypothetical protein